MARDKLFLIVCVASFSALTCAVPINPTANLECPFSCNATTPCPRGWHCMNTCCIVTRTGLNGTQRARPRIQRPSICVGQCANGECPKGWGCINGRCCAPGIANAPQTHENSNFTDRAALADLLRANGVALPAADDHCAWPGVRCSDGGRVSAVQIIRTTPPLRVIPPSIASLDMLESLSLGGNDIYELPDEIAKLPRLVMLDLCGNKLQACPDVVPQLVARGCKVTSSLERCGVNCTSSPSLAAPCSSSTDCPSQWVCYYGRCLPRSTAEPSCVKAELPCRRAAPDCCAGLVCIPQVSGFRCMPHLNASSV